MKTGTQRKICIILGPPDDRRCFDLFNWLRVEHPEWRFAITAAKLSVMERQLYPDVRLFPSKSAEAILMLVKADPETSYVYLPFFEDDIKDVLQYRSAWPTNFKALLPDIEKFALATNKLLFTDYFQNRNLVAKSYTRAALEASFPEGGVVSKPALGRGAIGMKFITSPEALEDIFPGDVIQEKLGDGHSVTGAFFFCVDGEVKVHYQHRRLRTYPSTGGVSVYAAIENIPQIARKGAEILKDLQWNGLAMLEFLPHSQSGEYLAIECNTRLWGSCQLGEFAGYAPVEAYILHCLGESMPVKNLRPNARINWYFPYQILYVLGNPFSRLGKLFPEKDTSYISATRAGMYRSLLYILYNVFNRHKWEILWKKITKSR
jgi:hypothetical protein